MHSVILVIGALLTSSFTTFFWFLAMIPVLRLRFITDVDSVATRRAMEFVKRHHNFSAEWLVDGVETVPEGQILCIRRHMQWVAYAAVGVGLRRFGEESTTDLTIYWPRWRTPPPELVSAPCPFELRKGAVMLRWMIKLASDYCGWDKEEHVFNIDQCPPEASKVAAVMKAIVETKFTRSCVFYVNGPPDTGKTTSGLILAHLMGGHYVDSYDFTNSSHRLKVLLKIARPTPQEPLIISVSEADHKIIAVAGATRKTKSCDRQDVYDKGTLNDLLDSINHIHENVVLLLSGNTPFKHMELRLNEIIGDTSCTKATRMTVMNIGGDSDFQRDDLDLVTPMGPMPMIPMAPGTPDIESESASDIGSESD